MTLKRFALALAATALVVAPATGFAASEATTPAATEAKPSGLPAIRVTEVTERTLTDRVIVTGTIQSVEDVYVQPQVDGLRIETLNADVGDVVKAGDVLATLSEDSLLLQKSQLEANRARTLATGAQLQAQLVEAKANAAEAARQANRAETLVKSRAVSVSQVEQLRASSDAANARVNSAEQAILGNVADVKVVDTQIDDINLKLARTDVKTPVGGVVSVRNAKIGAIAAGAGNPLFSIIRDNAIELNADVAEGDLLKLIPGQAVHVAVAGTSTKVEGKIRSIDPIIDETTRLGKVRISIDEPEKARVGMFASAEIVVSERKVLTLPMTAVTMEKDGMVARQVVDGVVKMVPITVGVQDGDFIEISQGLKLKDIVVEKAGAYVRNGDRVSPVFSQNTASN